MNVILEKSGVVLLPVANVLSRRILIVLSLAMFCAMLGMGIISPILPLYAQNLGASGFALGMIIGAFSLSRSGGMIVSGELAEHMDKKRLLLGGLAFYAAASVSYTFANSTASLILIRMGHGLGSAMVVPITMAIATDIAPEGEQGAFFGTLQGAQFLGVGCGPLLSGLLAENFGLMAPFYGMTALTLLSMTFVFLWLPWKISSGSSISTSMGGAFSAILLDREMMRVFFFQFASAMCRGVLVMVIPLFASGFNLSFMQIGFVVSLNSLATGLLQRFSGRMADRFPKRKMILAGGLISAVTLIGLPNLTTPVSLALASVAFGVGHAFATPSLAAIAASRGNLYGSGRIMGLFNISFSVGMTIGPVLTGMLLDMTRTGFPFYLLSAILLSATLLAFSPRRLHI